MCGVFGRHDDCLTTVRDYEGQGEGGNGLPVGREGLLNPATSRVYLSGLLHPGVATGLVNSGPPAITIVYLSGLLHPGVSTDLVNSGPSNSS